MGKRHIKLSQKEEPAHDPEEEEKVRQEFKEENDNRRKKMAFLEFKVSKMREELATVIYDTMNLVRKKQTRGYEEGEEVEEE